MNTLSQPSRSSRIRSSILKISQQAKLTSCCLGNRNVQSIRIVVNEQTGSILIVELDGNLARSMTPFGQQPACPVRRSSRADGTQKFFDLAFEANALTGN